MDVRTKDGVRLALEEHGGSEDGPGVLLIHGFAQNRNTFTRGELLDGLVSCGLRVFTGELRGHGESERPLRWDLDAHLDHDLPALVDAVAEYTGGPVHLHGHSMGGMLGYALLARPTKIASLTTYCAPMLLGATRAAVRAAALLFGPLTAATRRVPMHHLLRAVSWPLTRPRPVPGLGAAQRFTSLVNPRLGPPEQLRAILAAADAESPAVARALAAMAVHRRPQLCGVNLERALHEAEIPVCIVVGTHDVFAPPESVAPIRRVGQAGPRRLIVIPDGSHVDVPVGHHAFRLGQDVWRFVSASS